MSSKEFDQAKTSVKLLFGLEVGNTEMKYQPTQIHLMI
jgi:hypothetical protein